MELKRIFKYRDIWLGVAMIWIAVFHSGILFDSEFLTKVKEFGYAGVDICLFASGIGCYYSLEKDPDILRFLKRRVKRLGPTYLCFIIPWNLWKKKVSDLPILAALGNLLGIRTLASWDYQFNWYIGALVVFYICIPYLKQITDSCRSWRQDLVAGLLLVVVSASFWNTGKNMIIIMSRLPVLYAGLVFAKIAGRGYILKKMDYLLLGILTVCGHVLLWYFYNYWADYLLYYGLYWYPFALSVPGTCVFISLLAEQMQKSSVLRMINRFLALVGIYSFEVYLIHLYLYGDLMSDIRTRFGIEPNNLQCVLMIPVIVCGVFLLNRMGGFLSKLLEGFGQKEKA